MSFYIDGDLRKLNEIHNLYINNKNSFDEHFLKQV